MTLTSGHCCACTGVCGHIGGPWFCDQHKPRTTLGVGASMASLIAELAETRAALARLGLEHAQAAGERDAMRADVERLTAERDSQARYAEALNREVEQLRAQVCGHDLEAFDRQAKENAEARTAIAVLTRELLAQADELANMTAQRDRAVEERDEAQRAVEVLDEDLAHTIEQRDRHAATIARVRELADRAAGYDYDLVPGQIYAALDGTEFSDEGEEPV